VDAVTGTSGWQRSPRELDRCEEMLERQREHGPIIRQAVEEFDATWGTGR
jgi:hypothetical protein